MSWWVIIIIGLASYGLRASFLLIRRGSTNPRLDRALRLVPAAVLPALAVSAVIGTGEQLDMRFMAAAVAAVVIWRTNSVAAAMGSGMLALWGLQWMLG